MPKISVSDLQEYLDEDQGEQVPRKYSRKEKKEKKEALPTLKFSKED
jgi:hypothetical protein